MANTLGVLNPFRYRGYCYDMETGLYYLNSRYYDAVVGRFINADGYVTTGQGVQSCNMYAYCINNPVNYIDRNGTNAEALQWWAGTMWWLCGVDSVLPVGDVIYGIGIVVLSITAIVTVQSVANGEISWDSNPATEVKLSSSDDDYDDQYDSYYDDSKSSNREKMGKSNGNAPRDNKKQNKQFNAATKGLSKEQREQIHREVTKRGLGYQEIRGLADSMFSQIRLRKK